MSFSATRARIPSGVNGWLNLCVMKSYASGSINGDLLPDGRFNASPEGLRYPCYTELDAEGRMTLNSYIAEELAKEFYRPDDVRKVLEKYTK